MTLLWKYTAALSIGALVVAGVLFARTFMKKEAPNDAHREISRTRTLEVTTTEGGRNAHFEQEFFSNFARQNGIQLVFLPPTETVRGVLGWYQQLLSRHSPQPDLYEIDVVWPAVLADQLIDLAPYFQTEMAEIDPEVLRSFTIQGRLVALPTFIDAGALFYRTDLLKKYGYRDPPASWERLQEMARRIQEGERKAGKVNFWGYVWQGGAYEGLTCDALEWQASAGAPGFSSSSQALHVNNPEMTTILKRAVSWIGSISPPGEAYYRETDSVNFWNEGNAAFMRSWLSTYSLVEKDDWPLGADFQVTALPGGPAGRHGTIGGLGMGISRYSKNKELAINALRGLTSAASERQRAIEAGTVPVRKTLRTDPALMAKTVIAGKAADQVMGGLVSRSAVASGSLYPKASEAYFKAINSVLVGSSKPEQAMNELEAKLAALRRMSQ